MYRAFLKGCKGRSMDLGRCKSALIPGSIVEGLEGETVCLYVCLCAECTVNNRLVIIGVAPTETHSRTVTT